LTDVPTPTYTFYAYNLNPSTNAGKRFAHKAVRQSLLFALNRQQIVTAVFFGHGSVANSVQPPTSWTYKHKPKVLYSFDKAKAESMLDAAGWVKRSDGIRAKGDLTLTFRTI